MKIILINNLFKPFSRGGAERIVEIIADGLEKAGHEVVIVSTRPLQFSIFNFQFSIKSQTLNAKYQKYCFYVWNLISYYNLNKLPKILRVIWHVINIFNPQSYFKIKKILKIEKPDIVMTHNLIGIGFLISRAMRKSNVKWIHTLHDIQLLHPSGLMLKDEENITDGFFAKLYQKVNRKLFSSPDIVISPSHWLMDMHAKRGFFSASKKLMMKNPVPISSWDCRTPLRFARNDSKNKFIFLYVGQIEEHKGVCLLAEAFNSLDNENTELWIVGDGAKITDYQLLITNYNNIKFLGKKNQGELKKIMKQANCLVVPSLCYENSPTVILEAQAIGLPVIASDIGGISEILDTQFLFKVGDEESLKNKMQWILDSYGKITVEQRSNISVDEYIEKILAL